MDLLPASPGIDADTRSHLPALLSRHGLKDKRPDFFGDAAGDDDGKRVPEKRRQVLAYVRQRPEQLRPWVAADSS